MFLLLVMFGIILLMNGNYLGIFLILIALMYSNRDRI
jgi:hypothetical protein